VPWNDMPNHWYEDYERGRPGYPLEVVHIQGLPSSATVLDLGAGTGKLTRLLASRFVRVVAVEPDVKCDADSPRFALRPRRLQETPSRYRFRAPRWTPSSRPSRSIGSPMSGR